MQRGLERQQLLSQSWKSVNLMKSNKEKFNYISITILGELQLLSNIFSLCFILLFELYNFNCPTLCNVVTVSIYFTFQVKNKIYYK